MEKKKNIIVKNYAAFIPDEKGERRYKIVTDKEGNELGFEVSGRVTQFGAENENGLNFDRKSYDKCIAEYFERNDLNIPIDLMHGQDVRDLCGVAKKFVKKSDGVDIVAFVPRCAYYYNMLKGYIDNGMLQGFSNFGCVRDWDFDRESGAMIIKEFFLISVSLVATPADTYTKFVANSTSFEGFETKPKKELPIELKLMGV